MRTFWKFFMLLAVLGLGFAAPAVAGVPKVVFFDEFGFAL
jgi:hypothetical protein